MNTTKTKTQISKFIMTVLIITLLISIALPASAESKTISFEGKTWYKEIRGRGSASTTDYFPSEQGKVTWSTANGELTALEASATYLRYVGFAEAINSETGQIHIEGDWKVSSGHSSPRRMYVGIFNQGWGIASSFYSTTSTSYVHFSYDFSVTPDEGYYIFFFYSDAWSYDWNTKIYLKNYGPPAPTKVAHYELDGNTLDSSGNNKHATNYGATFSSVVDGSVAYFNGNDKIEFPALGNSQAGSISFWANVPNWNRVEYLMDGRGTGNWWLLKDYASGACIDSNGNICFNGRVEVPSSMLVNNQWHHIVVTADLSATKIYLDGNLIDTGSGLAINLDSVRIGTRYTNNNYLNGYIDDVQIYNYVLSGIQVSALNTYNLEIVTVQSQNVNKGNDITLPVTLKNTGNAGNYYFRLGLYTIDYTNYDPIFLEYDLYFDSNQEIQINLGLIPVFQDQSNSEWFALNTGQYGLDLFTFHPSNGYQLTDYQASALTINNPNNIIFAAVLEDPSYFGTMIGEPSGIATKTFLDDSFSHSSWMHIPPGEPYYYTYYDGLEDLDFDNGETVDLRFTVFPYWYPDSANNIFDEARDYAGIKIGIQGGWAGGSSATYDQNHGFDMLIGLTDMDSGSLCGVASGGIAIGSSHCTDSSGSTYGESYDRSMLILVHEVMHNFGARELENNPDYTGSGGYIMDNGQNNYFYPLDYEFHILSYDDMSNPYN